MTTQGIQQTANLTQYTPTKYLPPSRLIKRIYTVNNGMDLGPVINTAP